MNHNIYSEKDSFGSKPNRKTKKDEWAEESFSTDTNPSSHRVRKKASKIIKEENKDVEDNKNNSQT